MATIGNYLSFIKSGVKGNILNGRAFGFLAGELSAKSKRLQNEAIRRRFDNAKAADYLAFSIPEKLPNVRVFSLCHSGGVPEQKLSILSFLKHVGRPESWSVVSDGSLTDLERSSLVALHPSIAVVDWHSFLNEQNKSCYEKFIKYTIFAKKLVVESNIPVDGVSLYIDTDILFLSGGCHLRRLLMDAKGRCFYQRDLPGYLDSSILSEEEASHPPLNAGFVVLGRRIDWQEPISRLESFISEIPPDEKRANLEKLEQSVAHLAHCLAGSQALDERYVLQIVDRFEKSDRFCDARYAMRHYVRPVRHKMWLHASEYLAH